MTNYSKNENVNVSVVFLGIPRAAKCGGAKLGE
jgi:hypothetical protein